MKQIKWISTFIITAMLSPLMSFAASPNQESAGQYVDDTVITTKIKSAIVSDPMLSISEIKVATYKGVVQLSGFVGSDEKIAKAMEVARNVDGVTSVKNDMQLK
ncbi:MAG: BON domain-containing protein [Pseudomonadota bacterium]